MIGVDFTDHSLLCRILAIDNGTDKVGFTVCDYNVSTGRVDIVLCETFEVPSGYRNNPNRSYYFRGAFESRLQIISEHYKYLLDEFEPDLIACESPFGHRHLQAFKTLTLSMQMFDDLAYWDYPHIDFMRVAPFEAKKAAVGDNKFSHDKDKIHEYVLKNKNLYFSKDIDIRSLGPDALDSITVAMAAANRVLY